MALEDVTKIIHISAFNNGLSPCTIDLHRDDDHYPFWTIAVRPGSCYMWPYMPLGALEAMGHMNYPILSRGQRVSVKVSPMTDCAVDLTCSIAGKLFEDRYRVNDGVLKHERIPHDLRDVA